MTTPTAKHVEVTTNYRFPDKTTEEVAELANIYEQTLIKTIQSYYHSDLIAYYVRAERQSIGVGFQCLPTIERDWLNQGVKELLQATISALPEKDSAVFSESVAGGLLTVGI